MKIRELRVRTVRVPMREPHRTASGTVEDSPLVLADALTDSGIEGHSITFTYTAAALEPVATFMRNVAPLVAGENLAPLEVERKLARRFRLLGARRALWAWRWRASTWRCGTLWRGRTT